MNTGGVSICGVFRVEVEEAVVMGGEHVVKALGGGGGGNR